MAGLTRVPLAELERLLRALHRGHLSDPVTRASMIAVGLAHVEGELGALQGLSVQAATRLVSCVLAERHAPAAALDVRLADFVAVAVTFAAGAQHELVVVDVPPEPALVEVVAQAPRALVVCRTEAALRPFRAAERVVSERLAGPALFVDGTRALFGAHGTGFVTQLAAPARVRLLVAQVRAQL